jgi:hypothetical protein
VLYAFGNEDIEALGEGFSLDIASCLSKSLLRDHPN